MKNDDKIRALLQQQLPKHQPAPWFTKKVMNRLPERHIALVARLEMSVYIMALLATLAYGVFTTLCVIKSGTLTVSNLVSYLAVLGLSTGLCFMLISPYVEQSKNNV